MDHLADKPSTPRLYDSMHRAPLERRKSFWFGSLVLIFLAWAAWQSFARPYWLHGWDTGKNAFGFTRMNGSTYLLQGWPGTSKGWVNEALGSLYPSHFVQHWKSFGIRVWRLPDAATATLFVIAWIGWLAWLEKKGEAGSESRARGKATAATAQITRLQNSPSQRDDS